MAVADLTNTYRLYTDGGARGNPGPAAIGVVLLDPNNEPVTEFNKYIGVATNNEAEYAALIYGLEIARQQKVEHIECFLDSELVVYHLDGQYKVKSDTLKQYYDKALTLAYGFKSVRFIHIPRGENKRADELVNEALDKNAQ